MHICHLCIDIPDGIVCGQGCSTSRDFWLWHRPLCFQTAGNAVTKEVRGLHAVPHVSDQMQVETFVHEAPAEHQAVYELQHIALTEHKASACATMNWAQRSDKVPQGTRNGSVITAGDENSCSEQNTSLFDSLRFQGLCNHSTVQAKKPAYSAPTKWWPC